MDVLDVANAGLVKIFGVSFKTQTADLLAEYEDVNEIAVNVHELMLELRETNDSLLSAKQNEIMKNLTLMAFITFPLSLFVAILGLRAAHTPFVNGAYGFEIIISLTIIAVAFMLWFFKKKNWL
jgi:Mg2+ and Co2+ transporter CorA